MQVLLSQPETVRLPAVGFYAGGRVRIVDVVVPLTGGTLAKAEQLGFGEVGSDPSGGQFRWITVHPHGKDTEGVAVKIRESKSQKGVWHVVGGAGGKLNYLKLTNVKSPEEYKAKQAEKKRQKKAAEKEKAEAERQRKESLSPEERESEAAAKRLQKEKQQEAEQSHRLQQQEHVKWVAETLGWDEGDWQFEPVAERLREAGASKERVLQQEKAHWDRMYKRAMDVEKATRRQVLLDHEMRAEAGLGEVPLRSDDPEVIALSDLAPDPVKKGLGYKRDLSETSAQEITRELATTDVKELQKELADLQNVDGDSPAREGEITRVQTELMIAQAHAEYGGMDEEELGAKQESIEKSAKEFQEKVERSREELEKLKDEAGEDPTREQQEAISRAQLAMQEEKQAVDALKEQLDMIDAVVGDPHVAVTAEQKEISKRRQEERETEIRLEKGQEGVEAYRESRERLEAGGAKYRAEIKRYKERGVLKKPKLQISAPKDPKKAMELLRRAKSIRQLDNKMKRQKSGKEEVDDRLFGKGYFVETRSAKVDESIKEDLRATLAEARTKAFLHELEAADQNPTLADLTDDEQRQSMERHLSAGTYNALNTASLSLLDQGVIKRDVVDVLGAAGAAQVMARAIREVHGDDLEAVQKGIEEFHLANHMEQADEAIRSAQATYDEVRDIELGMANSTTDMASLQELNGRRREKLLEARETLGQALGEMEAYSALSMALKEDPRKDLDVALGPISSESAIRQARAIGLGRDDYTLDSDGTNRFLKVKDSGMAKLVSPIDHEELKARNEVEAIKRGERDEEGYLPPGLISRPATWFDDPEMKAPRIGQHHVAENPFESWGQSQGGLFGGGGAGNAVEDFEDYMGARLADGEHPDEVFSDVISNMIKVPEAARKQVWDHMNEILPQSVPLTENGRQVWAMEEVQKKGKDGKPIPKLGKDGKPTGEFETVRRQKLDAEGNKIPAMQNVTASHHSDKLKELADKFVSKYYGSNDKVTSFHSQGLKVETPEDAKKTGQAMYMALAEDPRALVAFKDPGDMTSQDKAALRHYYQTEIGAGQVDQKAIEKEIAKLGKEPEKYSGEEQVGLFGGGTSEKVITPAWTEWNRNRQSIMSDAHARAGDVEWAKYVGAHRSVKHAYEALQDHCRGAFNERFAKRYAAVHGEPLRLGKTNIRNAERHVAIFDPEMRKELEEQRQKLQGAVQQRTSTGKYSDGGLGAKMDRVMRAEKIATQNQTEILPAGEMSAKAREAMEKSQRVTLGERAENQIASLMGNVGKSFDAQKTTPVDLFPDFKMSGKAKIHGTDVDLANQQRTVKAFLARKRLGAFLGVGSGKTPIAIGAFTAAASDPKRGVKRGLFLARSNNLGQFHGEFAKFADPEKFRWSADPSADNEKRMATHKDPDTHMVAMTHEGYRDDMLRLLQEHQGHKDRDETRDWFMGLSREERAGALKEAWDKAGVDYQASFIDEGHVTLDRAGKKESLLSAITMATSDNTSHYMAMTADPLKNDISEIRSQLDKIHTDGRYSDEAAWHRRYGLNTSASRAALQQEVSGTFFTDHIRPPVKADRRKERVQMSEWQTQEYAKVRQAYDRLRLDRSRGKINVDAAKQLSPQSFEGVPEERHEEVARALTDAAGAIKEAALHRVVNMAPPEHNAKMTKLKELLKEKGTRENPTVIFAHNLDTVDKIGDELKKDGHRVTTFHGGHLTAEKDQRRRQFMPDPGKDPEADVIVMSDCGATGVNLQRANRLVQFDTPPTAMIHNQRNGRIHRLGQKQDVELVDLVSDSPFEERALQRVERKYDLGSIFATNEAASLDEGSLGWHIQQARQKKNGLAESKAASLAA